MTCTQQSPSTLQKTILVSLALQHRSVDDLAQTWLTPKMAPMPASQLLGHFKRAMIKINDTIRKIQRVSLFLMSLIVYGKLYTIVMDIFKYFSKLCARKVKFRRLLELGFEN